VRENGTGRSREEEEDGRKTRKRGRRKVTNVRFVDIDATCIHHGKRLQWHAYHSYHLTSWMARTTPTWSEL
jgi:hypothetical protein